MRTDRILEVKAYINEDYSIDIFDSGEHSIQYHTNMSQAIIAMSFIRAEFEDKGFHEEHYDFSFAPGRKVELEMIKHVHLEERYKEIEAKKEKKWALVKWITSLVGYVE